MPLPSVYTQEEPIDIEKVYADIDAALKPKVEFMGGLKAIGRQIVTLPEETISAGISALQGQSGVDLADPDIVDKAQNWFEKRRNEREMKEAERLGDTQIIPGIKTTDVTSGLGQSLAFSTVTAGTGIGTGLATGGVAGTGVALGTAYRMASNQVMRQYLTHMNEAKIKERGQGLTNEEEEALKSEFSDRATKYGLWEAVPEVAGGLIGLKVLTTPLKKMIGKNVLVKGLAKAAGVVLPEIGEETATQIGQSQTLAGTPLQEGKVLDFSIPGIVEGAKQVIPQTVLISALMGGVGAVAVNKYNAKKASLLKEMVNKEQGHKLLDDEKLNNVYKNFADIVESRPNDKELQTAYASILGEIERRKTPEPVKELPKEIPKEVLKEAPVETPEVAETKVESEKPLARDLIARMQNQRLMNMEAAREKYGLQPTTVTAEETSEPDTLARKTSQETLPTEASAVASEASGQVSRVAPERTIEKSNALAEATGVLTEREEARRQFESAWQKQYGNRPETETIVKPEKPIEKEPVLTKEEAQDFAKMSDAEIVEYNAKQKVKPEMKAEGKGESVEAYHVGVELKSGMKMKPDRRGLVWFSPTKEAYGAGKKNVPTTTINIPKDKLLVIENIDGSLADPIGQEVIKATENGSKEEIFKEAEKRGYLAVQRSKDISMRPETAEKLTAPSPDKAASPVDATKDISVKTGEGKGEIGADVALAQKKLDNASKLVADAEKEVKKVEMFPRSKDTNVNIKNMKKLDAAKAKLDKAEKAQEEARGELYSAKIEKQRQSLPDYKEPVELSESAPKEGTKAEYSLSEGDTNNGLSMFQRRNGSYPTTESGAIRYFEESLAERTARSVPEGTVRVVEAVSKERKVIKAIGKSFGLKVVFLKSNKEYPLGFNGVVIPEIPNTIFLSVDPIGGNMLSVAGHETLHVLKNSNPELYNFLAEQLVETSVGFKEYQARKAATYEAYKASVPDAEGMFTEFLGDFAGDQFTNKDFWDKLYGKSPSLTEKLIKTVKGIVDKMLRIARNFKSENHFTDVKKAQDVLAEVMGEFSKRQKTDGKAEATETQYSLASPEAYMNETKEWIDATRKAWSSRGMYQKNPGLISKAFDFVFGSPEWSSHPVMQALSDTFIERSAWFNENFKKFVEGDHPETKFETMNEALDSLNEEQMDKFAELDNQFDTSGFTQNEARAYMEKNNIDPAIREVWEAKTARMNTVWDAHMAPIIMEVNEIDARAMIARKDPVYPIVSYEIKYVEDSKGNINPQFNKSKPITLKDVLEMMREIKEYAYSPRIREQGAYAVRGFKPAEGREFMKFENNLVAAEKLKAELKKDGWSKLYITESNVFPESVLAGLKEMDVAKLIQAASEKNDKDAVSEVFTKEISDAVHQIILARGYRRHTIARQDKIVEGYETDPRKKLFTYFTNSAAGLAKSKAARQVMDIMLGGINEGTPEGHRIARILGEYHKNPIKANEEARLYDTAKKYISDNLRNIDEADKMVATVKKLATFKYLSWTLRAPLVNTTALITTVLPSIHQYCSNGEKQTKQSFMKIIKEIGIAGGQYAKIMASQKNKGIKAPELAYDEQSFINEINRKEYDDPQMVRDMMTSMQASSGKMFDNIVQWGMIPFKASEQWMRGLTMLAGYRIAKASGLSTVQAREVAIKAAGNAHGVYGKATRQYWAQGTDPAARIGQVATTFLKFPQNYLNLLYDLGWDKGNIKAFTWAIAAPVVLGGAVAIPFYSNVVWMINAMLKALGDDRDIEKMVYDDARLYLGKEAEKNIRTGLMGAAGIDITGSLSMGIGLPTDLLSLTGIFGAMAKETSRASHFISTKQYSKALETALPSGVANLFRAVRELDGATTSTGARVWNENGTPYIPDVSETTLRIFGFRSSERTTTQQRQWESQREEKRFNETRNKIYERYRAYLAKGKPNPKTQKEIMNSIYAYNKSVYDSGRAGLVPFIGQGQLTRQARAMVVPSKKQRMRMIPLEEKD